MVMRWLGVSAMEFLKSAGGHCEARGRHCRSFCILYFAQIDLVILALHQLFIKKIEAIQMPNRFSF